MPPPRQRRAQLAEQLAIPRRQPVRAPPATSRPIAGGLPPIVDCLQIRAVHAREVSGSCSCRSGTPARARSALNNHHGPDGFFARRARGLFGPSSSATRGASTTPRATGGDTESLASRTAGTAAARGVDATATAGASHCSGRARRRPPAYRVTRLHCSRHGSRGSFRTIDHPIRTHAGPKSDFRGAVSDQPMIAFTTAPTARARRPRPPPPSGPTRRRPDPARGERRRRFFGNPSPAIPTSTHVERHAGRATPSSTS